MSDVKRKLALFQSAEAGGDNGEAFERIRQSGIFETEDFSNRDFLMAQDNLDKYSCIVVYVNDSGLEDLIDCLTRGKATRFIPVMMIVQDNDFAVVDGLMEGNAAVTYGFIGGGFEIDEFRLRLSQLIDTMSMHKCKNALQKDYERAERKINTSVYTDCLTGLYTRQRGMSFLEEEILRISDTEEELSVIICDVDYFKNINDYYGREFGDQIFKSIARIVRKFAGDGIKVVQWYGMSLLIILPGHGIDAGLSVAGDMKEAIESTLFKLRGVQMSLTATFAVAAYRSGDDFDSLIDRLESKLHVGKMTARSEIYF